MVGTFRGQGEDRQTHGDPVKRRALLLGVLVASPPVFAGGPGSRGAEVLKLEGGPRAYALGDARAALLGDAYSLFGNPAGLASLERAETAFLYNRGVEGIGEQSLLGALPVGRRSVLAAGMLRLDSGSIDGFDASGVDAGTVNAEDLVGVLGWARSAPLGRTSLDFGAAFKWLRSRLDTVRASAYAFDLGTAWRRELAGGTLTLGASARNLGSGIRYDRETASLPTQLAVGAALSRRAAGGPWTTALELRRSADDTDRPRLAVALEGSLMGVVRPRVGFFVPNDLGPGLSFGLGLVAHGVRIDYALSLMGEFGAAHRIGIGFRWGEPVETARREEDLRRSKAHWDLGRRFLREKRALDALDELNKALRDDPGNAAIVEDMRKAHDLLR